MGPVMEKDAIEDGTISSFQHGEIENKALQFGIFLTKRERENILYV